MVDPVSKHSELVEESTLSSAAVLCRDDGRVLLLQYLDDGSPFAGRWSLPMMSVNGNETSEEALVRLLREHVTWIPEHSISRKPFMLSQTVGCVS